MRPPRGYPSATMLIGAHESVAGGPSTAFPRADEDGCEALQIFARPSAQWRTKPLDPAEVARFRRERAARGWPTMAHASYLINLCASDPALLDKSRRALEEELVRGEELGIDYVVLHPGAHVGCGEEAGLDVVAASISWLAARTRGFHTRLLLEITAGQGSCLGCRFEHLARIFDRARDADRLGVCFDTCHAHAAGHDMTTEEGYDRVFAALDREVGLGAVKAFHLNDSKTPLGSRVDRHAEIGDGFVGLYPFWRLVNDPRFAEVPGVVETPPGPDKKMSFGRNIARLKALRGASRPTAPPPPQIAPAKAPRPARADVDVARAKKVAASPKVRPVDTAAPARSASRPARRA
jgi:deoxyribonuclease-4